MIGVAFHVVAAFAAAGPLLGAPSPPANAAATAPNWTVLAYLDARGGLDDAATAYEAKLYAAADAAHLGLAMQTISSRANASLLRRKCQTATGDRVAVGAEPAADAAQMLAEFVAWGTQVAPARHYALLIMGHGAGLLQAPSLPPDALRPQTLRVGLEMACSRLGQPLDVIGLDTCYGGTLEVAYSLRKVTRYLTATPGLIYSPGLDWAGALSDLSVRPEAPTLVRGLVQRGMPRRNEPLALVGIDMRQLEQVCLQVQHLSIALRMDLKQELPVLVSLRSRCQSWGDKRELVDLGALAEALGTSGLTPDVRKAATDLRHGLGSLTLCSWMSPDATSSGVGVGAYFPPTFEPVPPDYLELFEFPSTSEWGTLLESYWARLVSNLTDATNGP